MATTTNHTAEYETVTAAVTPEKPAEAEPSVVPGFAEEPVTEAVVPEASTPVPASPVPTASEKRVSWFSEQPIRLMLVVLVGVLALFFAFGLLVIFAPTGSAIAALAVIATPIASMVAAYYGITLSMQQVREEREEREKAVARANAAETAAREADVWAAQMESGLRVAKVKLDAAGLDAGDVAKAAGVTNEFF